jgi:hypothetical protein
MVLKGHHGVIGVADQLTLPFEARPHRRLEPHIQHIMQVEVREQRRNGSLNAKGNFLFQRTIPDFRSGFVLDLRRKG